MSTEKHVEAELIDYLDGEVSAADKSRIEAHLMQCGQCRTALDELRLLQQNIDGTLDQALTPIRLSYQADARIRHAIQTRLEPRPGWWQALWQRRGLITQALMAVFAVILSAAALRVMTPAVPEPMLETIVLGQERYAPGSQGALRVVVQSLGTALPFQGAEVVVNLVMDSGVVNRLYSGQTDATGSAKVNFTVPDMLDGQGDLIVETRSSAGTERIVRPIHIERSHKIFLGSDKPAYRPGQTVYLRALVLDAVTGQPPAGDKLAFQVVNDDGSSIFDAGVEVSPYGIGYTEFVIPESLPLGPYTIRAGIGDFWVERLMDVNLYPPPAFQVALETDKTFVMPGESIHGSVVCSYFFGKPVQGSVRITVFAGDGMLIAEQTGALDADGVFVYQINVPEGIQDNAVSIVASVLDPAGQIEGIQRDLPLSAAPIHIHAIPESGRLKPGVDNAIYMTTVYPDGLPAQTEMMLTIDGRQSLLLTDAYGMAVFNFVPDGSTNVHVVAKDSVGLTVDATIRLTADPGANTLLLRANKAAYTVGETMALESLVAGDNVGVVYMDVIRSGQIAAVLSAPVVDNRAVFALDLDANLTGALNLRAYALRDGKVIAEDTRNVVVDPAGSLAVRVNADQESYQPGASAHLKFTTTLEDKAGTQIPAQSALGIAVVDTSVLALDMLPPGFARTYFLMDNALIDRRAVTPGFDPARLLEGEVTLRQAQDVMAQAAWAGLQTVAYTAPATVRMEGVDQNAVLRTQFAAYLPWMLIILPVGISLTVIRGLQPTGVLGRASKRLGWGLAALAALSPAMLVGVFLEILLPWIGAALTAGLLFIAVVLMFFILILSWVLHDTRMQLVTGMLVIYVVIALFTLLLAAMSAGPSGGWIVVTTAAFLLLLASVFVMGQGLVLEGRRLDGWLLSILVIVLILLAVSLPGVPQLRSNLSRAISNPFLYTGPAGWLTGCSAATYEPAQTEAPAAEKETEATMMPAPTPSPMPTAMAQPQGTATPLSIPLEPYPFRQIFPETLFWAPEVQTSVDGALR